LLIADRFFIFRALLARPIYDSSTNTQENLKNARPENDEVSRLPRRRQNLRGKNLQAMQRHG
jgi:hypothetical protein